MNRILPFLLLLLFISIAGCSGPDQVKPTQGSFQVDETGLARLTLPEPAFSENVLETGDISVTDLTIHTFDGDTSAVLVAPGKPVCGLVWVPGAGVPAAGHIEHAKAYAADNIAVVVVDVRGNGGKTPGYPLDLERDFQKFASGEWPQYYQIVADCMYAKKYLNGRFGNIPIWIAGESNGGRYAAEAAAIDPGFSGYFGISTSGFGKVGLEYDEPASSFLLSVDPTVAVPSISPRPVYIFHAPDDTIIPIADGKALAAAAGEPVSFIRFNGTHGVNGEVDATIRDILSGSVRKKE